MSGALLSVARLNAGYGEMPVLRDLSLDIRPAEIVAMVGSNGESPATISFVPYAQAYPSGGFEEIPARQPEIAKIRSYTRWRPKLSLEDILRDVIAAHEVPHAAPVAEELLVPAIA